MARRSDTASDREWQSRRARARALGDRVRAQRIEAGLSQEKLGELCGLHRTYVGQVERGEVNVTLYNLGLLAEGLGVDIAELVQGLRRAG